MNITTNTCIQLAAIAIELAPGERYSGAVLDANGLIAHHLILLPARPDVRKNWDDAKAWASSVGGDLPSPQEQTLLFANCRDALPQTWCWSNKDYEKGASYAWGCYFDYGYLHDSRKSYKGSAVAVRRLALESFNPSCDSSAHVCTPIAPGGICYTQRPAIIGTQETEGGAA
jgi:hypothetical protein